MTGDKDALRAVLGRLGSSIGSAALVLALSFAIAWPLWKFATTARSAFTLAVGAALALSLSSLVAVAALRRMRGGSRYREGASKRGQRRSL
jgi:hypothetical protein